MKKHFEIKSPRSGENYCLVEVLSKFLERRNFEFTFEKSNFPGQYPFGNDYDGVIRLTARTYESLWCASIDAELTASVPYHVTDSGKITFGEFLSKDPQAELPEYYNDDYPVTITGHLGGESDSISFDWFDNFDENEIIIEIIKSAIIQAFIRDLLG